MSKLGQFKKIIENPNPSGLCMCGCGKKTPIAIRNTYNTGEAIHCPIRFIHGHNGKQNTKYLLPYRGCKKNRKYGPLSEEHKQKISRANSGPLSYKWKGGVTSKNSLDRVKFRIHLQKQIFERDNYTCQMCGIRGVDLQVDHIQSWAEYVELRFSMNNCRTLCAKCHYQITFGKPMPESVQGWGHHILKGAIL